MQSHYQRLTDSQWGAVQAWLPTHRKRKYPLRVITDAILWYLRVGSQWRNLPEAGWPRWQLVYYYFRKWQADGTLERLNWQLNRRERGRQGKRDTPSLLSIDSQSVKAAPFVAQERGTDGNKRVNGRKRHLLTDTLGLVWAVVVHAANRADGATAERVVAPLRGYLHRIEGILADAAYERVFSAWVRRNLRGVELKISSKPPSAEGFVPVRWRWVTERTFGTLNFFRRLDKDHEKTPQSAEAWVLWANCSLVLNRMD